MGPLTTGICSRLGHAPLSEVEAIDGGFTVQLRSIKRIVRALDRYWVTISDGDSFIQATLARRLHDLVTDETVTTNTVIAIDSFTCALIRSKRVFIILDMHVVSQTEERIGDPAPASSLAQEPAREALPIDTFDRKCVPGFPAAGDAQRRLTSPIGCINPFMRNWTIRARVVGKTEVRHYDRGRGGKVFKATLMDESQEIGAFAFDGAVDTIYDKLDKGSVYYISQAHITEVTEKFRANGIQNKYELKLEKDTKIEECLEPTSIPIVRYHFIPIASLEELRTGSFCDVLTILKDVGPLRRRRVCAAGSGIKTNRHVNVMDMSQHVVRITLWDSLQKNSPLSHGRL